jgi:hypothetical protein
VRRFPLLLLLAGCDGGAPAGAPPAAAPGGSPWLREAARERGLVFEHASGHRERYWMPEIMGGGVALFDPDGDGDLDAYLVQSGRLGEPGSAGADQLFANDGRGYFRDVGAQSGASDPGYGMGVACGDADGDGDTDLYVTNVGRNTLYRNEGELSFLDVTGPAEVGHEGWSTSAGFLDFDRDGELDLFVAGYLDWSPASELACSDPLGRPDYCSPRNYKTPARSALFRNLGAGRFEDVSRASGIASEPGTGLGVAFGDLDGDGWLDVFVANDGMPNHLWRNLGDGRFENMAMLAGCGVDSSGLPKAGMGVALADMDGDRDLDLLVGNLKGESDSCYRNEGGYFSDRTAALELAALSKPFTRFGLGLVDLDCDGWLDLYQANGRVERATAPLASDPYAEPNLLLAGRPRGGFAEVLPRGGTRELLLATSRGAAFGDVDGDGALDILVVNRDGPAHLFLNQKGGRWVLLRVLERSGADALGATLVLGVAGCELRRDVAPAFSYCASNDPRVHVGLGSAERVDSVLVRWVDGSEERFGPLAAGTVHELRRGAGTAADGD